MSSKFGLPLIFAGLLALTGGSVADAAAASARLVDPKPVLEPPRGPSAPTTQCVTISGTAYDGAVGQQQEPARTSTGRASNRWPTTRAR